MRKLLKHHIYGMKWYNGIHIKKVILNFKRIEQPPVQINWFNNPVIDQLLLIEIYFLCGILNRKKIYKFLDGNHD
uniref:Uncharacterized protein n=1 Tax=Romanomermis culicivorax TaxID=13658 RepID=A0A915IYA5_ROMCU